jgi:hypothetical protein
MFLNCHSRRLSDFEVLAAPIRGLAARLVWSFTVLDFYKAAKDCCDHKFD